MASANVADLEAALVNADAAGDTEAATALAAEVTRLREAPAEQPADLGPIQKLNKWLSDLMPASVNEAVDPPAQLFSGGIAGLSRMVMLPADLQKTVDQFTDSLGDKDNRGLRAAVLANPLMQMVVGASMLRKKLGLPGVTGSEELNKGMMDAGITAPEPTTGTGRVLRRTGEEIGAAALTAVPILRAASQAPNLAKTAPSLIRSTVEAARSDPSKFIRQDLTAAAGGGLGAGIAKEMEPGSSAAELIGLLTGTFAPTAAAGTVRRMVRGGEGTRQVMEKSIKEFAEAGVTPTVGMATRRRFNEAVESGLAILPGSSGRMAVYAESTARKLYDRVDDITSGIARIRSPDAAGLAIKKGITGFVDRFRTKWRAMDSVVDKVVPPKAAIAVPQTRATMVEMTDPATSAAFPQLNTLAQRLDDLTSSGAISYKDLRTFRSSVGGLIPESYTANLPQGMLKKLYGAMTADVRSHLAATDKAALKAFDRSSRYYAASMKRMDDSLAPLTNTDIPERVFMALERSGHAGPTVINAAKRSIGREAWDTVAATIFHRMGLAQAGAQSAAGDVFSANTFLTNWNKYARNRGTVEALTSGTSGGAGFVKDMNSVVRVAERFREAGRVFANPSGTARAIANVGLGTSVATSLLSGNLKTAAVILSVAGGANLSAGAFTNPKFVHFLARSTRVPEARIPSLVARLGSQLASEPEHVQAEIAGFLDRLSDEFSTQANEEQQKKAVKTGR